MIPYPHIDPIAFKIGPLKVHWYGLMYIFGFLSAWGLALLRAAKPNSGWNSEQVADLLFYAALGVILGGRIGYMLFYALPEFISNPLIIFKIWDGGMSFHGGLLGVMLAMWLYSRKLTKSFLGVVDFVVPLVPIGLGIGRIGNFINGELWGKVTTMPWGMIFPNAGAMPRHPSQLYESFFEGIVLFTVLWLYSSKPKPRGAVSALFLICYGCFRIFAEFFRQPDPQYGYLAFGWITMGMVLSAPMLIFGVILLWWAYKRMDSV